MCARYGGDEFVMLQELDAGENVDELCEKVRERIEKIRSAGTYDYPVSVSIGHSKYHGNDDIQSLIARADKRMYRNKTEKAAK